MGSTSAANKHQQSLGPPSSSKPSAKRGGGAGGAGGAGGGGGGGDRHIHHLPLPAMENPRNPHPETPIIPMAEASGHNDRAAPSSVPPPPYGPLVIDGTDDDNALQRSAFLSREEVVCRRSRRLKQLERYYMDQYWAMMEEVRVRHREYYWKYGKSPADEESGNGLGMRNCFGVYDATVDGMIVDRSGEAGRTVGFGEGENGRNKIKGKKDAVGFQTCAFNGCKSKAMALTSYCALHILNDTEQTLYKPCNFVTKSGPNGPIYCGKPALRSADRCQCSFHFQKTQRQMLQAVKKGRLPTPSSSRLAPKLHVIIAEFVKQIQTKRKKAK